MSREDEKSIARARESATRLAYMADDHVQDMLAEDYAREILCNSRDPEKIMLAGIIIHLVTRV